MASLTATPTPDPTATLTAISFSATPAATPASDPTAPPTPAAATETTAPCLAGPVPVADDPPAYSTCGFFQWSLRARSSHVPVRRVIPFFTDDPVTAFAIRRTTMAARSDDAHNSLLLVEMPLVGMHTVPGAAFVHVSSERTSAGRVGYKFASHYAFTSVMDFMVYSKRCELPAGERLVKVRLVREPFDAGPPPTDDSDIPSELATATQPSMTLSAALKQLVLTGSEGASAVPPTVDFEDPMPHIDTGPLDPTPFDDLLNASPEESAPVVVASVVGPPPATAARCLSRTIPEQTAAPGSARRPRSPSNSPAVPGSARRPRSRSKSPASGRTPKRKRRHPASACVSKKRRKPLAIIVETLSPPRQSLAPVSPGQSLLSPVSVARRRLYDALDRHQPLAREAPHNRREPPSPPRNIPQSPPDVSGHAWGLYAPPSFDQWSRRVAPVLMPAPTVPLSKIEAVFRTVPPSEHGRVGGSIGALLREFSNATAGSRAVSLGLG